VASRAVVGEAACEAARATAKRAAAAVWVAETELGTTVLRAPFGAVVAEISIEVGEWTTPSPPALPVPPVIDLLDTDSIFVSAPMDEVDSARIAVGQPARVTVDSHRGKTFFGTVVKTAVYVLDVEAQNRTVEIEVELDDEQFASTLLPGTSADVEVILQAREDVLRVPTVALIEGSRVLLVEDGRLTERPLETGLKNWNYTEVRSGLEAGDQVVVSLDRPEVQAGAEVVPTMRDESAEP
jgi:HlyD family secretion protein